MRPDQLELLRSPSGLALSLEDAVLEADEAVRGALVDPLGTRFPIRNGIPRFVPDEAYTASFGRQWQWYQDVQTESETSVRLTRERFFAGTGWSPEDLRDSLVLEAGCGAGRFTQVLLDAGARVCSFDFSDAVDACRTTVGSRPDHVLAQGDIFQAPFPEHAFDKVFCYGVLQHTPDPEGAFASLLRHVKPGGEIAFDVYRKAGRVNRWSSKYLYRPVTSRMDPEQLRRLVEWYIPRWLPIDDKLRVIPFFGRYLVSIVPCWNYAETIPDEDERRAWAVLDTFDALSARFDKPQTLESVSRWVRSAGLHDTVVRPGANGIVAKGKVAAG